MLKKGGSYIFPEFVQKRESTELAMTVSDIPSYDSHKTSIFMFSIKRKKYWIRDINSLNRLIPQHQRNSSGQQS